MGFHLRMLLISTVFLICGATPTRPMSRAKRDLSTEREEWRQIENAVTELLSACSDYTLEQQTVISAVDAFKAANTRLLETVENASMRIRMLFDAPVFPSLDENVYRSYQILLNYTNQDLVSGMVRVDSLATAFTSWINEEDWNKVLGDPIHEIQSVLEMVFNPEFGPLERHQGVNMLKTTCQKLDPASAVGYVWRHLSEGCPGAMGLAAELNTSTGVPNAKALPCAPAETMVNNNYTTAAALELVQFVGGMISNLGFVLATCLNVGFEASAKAEAFRFAASVNKVSNYLANHLFDLESKYFPDIAFRVSDTVIGEASFPEQKPGALKKAMEMLDGSYAE